MTKLNRNIIFGTILLFIVVITAYANHFHNGFHFDDSHTVVDNVHIRDVKNIPSFFSDAKMFSADPRHWGLRPLVTTTLAIDYWLGSGLNPFYFQLSTFVWFLLMGIFLFFIYKNLLVSSINHNWAGYIALAATAWYALHTANAETLNYVIARSDVLSTVGIVASFFIYIAYPAKRKWFLYVIPAFIGGFAKETTIVLVILLFFYILLFEDGLSIADLFRTNNFKLVWKAAIKLLPLFIVLAATQFYLIKTSAQAGSTASNISNPATYYILTQSYIWLHYFISFFLPMNLSADTDMTVIQNVFDERIILGIVFVMFLIVTIIKTSAKKENRPIAFGLIWFAAALLPTSLIPLSEVTNDHRMFFPFIGLTLSVVTYIGLWLINMEKHVATLKKYQVLIGIGLVVVLGLNAYGVYERNKVWKTDESLWLDVTIKSPTNGRGLMNYGLTQMAIGNYVAADNYFEKAVPYLPYYSTLYINIGILKGAINKPDEADANFKKAIALNPGVFDAYAYYARWLKQVNRIDEARQMAEKAVQINPYSLMALNILMGVDNALGLWDKLAVAANQYLAVIPDDPNAKTFLEAANTHNPVVELGAPVKSNSPLSAANSLDQSLAFYNAKEYDKCIEACKQALKLKPDYAAAYSNMGAAYNMLGQWVKGAEACKAALKIDPDYKLAKGNLQWAQSNIKN